MRMLFVVATAALFTGVGLSQGNSAPSNGAINPTGNGVSTANASGTVTMVAPSALEAGANSFTEGQVRARLEGAGFAGISDLHQDDQGIWRGRAVHDGRAVSVGFDFKGDIAER